MRWDLLPYVHANAPTMLLSVSSRHIVLGIDASSGAQAATRWCADHAAALDADVLAIHAVAPVLAGALPPLNVAAVVTAEELTRSAEAVEAWCAPLRTAHVACETQVVQGAAPASLMQLADEVNALMIVVGRRGEGGVAELVLGSVPRTLTHQCTRPVLVVPE